MTPSLDIIIPCYNPPNGWELELCKNFLSLKKTLGSVDLSLVLINDGSFLNVNDYSLSYITKLIPSVNFITYNDNFGKGYALRKGVSESNADFIIFTDVDFPYQIQSMVKVFKELQKDTDVAIGNRDENYYKKTPFIRRVISKSFRYLLKLFLNLKATDTQCGLKGFNKKGKEEFLKTTIDRFLFDLEFVKRCSQNKNIKIETVSVTLKEGVVFSQMNFKILFKEFINFLVILVKK